MLDLLLLILLLVQIVTGYREGFFVGVAGLVGLAGGAAIGVVLLPRVVTDSSSGVQRTLVVVVGTMALALGGRLLVSLLGRRLRRQVQWRPARVAESLLGAFAGLVSTLLVVSVVAGAARTAPLPGIVSAVTGSRVVGAVDQLVPSGTDRIVTRFWAAARSNGFPRVFSGLDPEPIRVVAPPAATAPDTIGLSTAAASIVKITGTARSCQRGLEGSGFVAGRLGGSARVVTNAHVVAGVTSPLVQPGGQGEQYPAKVVAYDEDLDLAVLDVPGLDAAALPRAAQLQTGDAAAVAGFPLDGPYSALPARIREVLSAQGRDIYDKRTIVREVYSLYANIQPGNSGGPLLTEDGEVVGVVFAESLDDLQTGYALTSKELDTVLTEAGSGTTETSTGACTAD